MASTRVLGPPRATFRRLAVDRGAAIVHGHHGEILQGIFAGDDGAVHRGLVTLPCPRFHSRATFVVDSSLARARDGQPRIRVRPATKTKALRAAELTLAYLGCEVGGALAVESNAMEGWGLGSSTSDVTASILAVGRALGIEVAPPDVARLAVSAECAADSVMFDGPAVLFAQREGRVLERFARPLPPLAVIGLNPAPHAGGVDTLAFPPAAYPRGMAVLFDELRAKLRLAIAAQDAARVGEVATASAIVNQAYLPVADFATLVAIARDSGAVGVQVAHSGCVAGLLFDAMSRDCGDAMARAEAALTRALPDRPRWVFFTKEH